MKQLAGEGDNLFTIAIIGGGFSGATLAAELLRVGNPSISVTLIEKDSCPGRGVAYGTRCDKHLLNVPAHNMSGLANDPKHFLRWARLHYDSAVQPTDFLPRRVYGRYVESILCEASEPRSTRFEWRQDEAISITRTGGRAEIALRSGDAITADTVVLALGNFPPGDLKLPGMKNFSPRYMSNGWRESALDQIAEDKSVLLVGSGLTSVDVAISLREQQFEGTIHVLSRHGLLPQQHKPSLPWASDWNNALHSTARGLLRRVRTEVREAQQQNVDWRAVVDSLRPVTQRIWQSLPLAEQRRFLRHLRSYWDVHRHRVAPEIGALLASELRDQRMQVHAGRVIEYREASDFVEVTYRDRHNGESKTLCVDRVINCTGPDADCRRVSNPLLKNLIHQKLVRPDSLFLGLDTSPNGALIDANGVSSDFLYTVGPLRKGNLWETMAVPEIRVQVSELALHLLASSEQRFVRVVPERPTASTYGSAKPEKDRAMYFEQFYLGCLAHASYMLASEGDAVVVDPQRDVEIYLQAAAKRGLKIRYIFETHMHADFVSGHKELAARTGAMIYVGTRANVTFPHVDVQDGFELNVGKMCLRVLETPGHSPESICIVVTDEEKSRKPWAVLTGDTLFIGDVGRPDLSSTHTPRVLAGMLYDSLHEKVLKLANDVLVYPAHGAGSLCGRNMRAERSSTIGIERLTNYALQIKNREEFIHALTTNLPVRPDYFLQDAQLNRQGASALSELPELAPISPHELASELEKGANVLDVRAGDRFAAGHVPGSVNIALSGQFASWAGIVFGLSSRPVLIGDTAEQISEARVRLARVGMEDVRGYLQGGVEGWREAGFALAEVRQVSVQTLREWQQRPGFYTLDVRREPEWRAGRIANTLWIPLDKLAITPLPVNRDAVIAVYCKGGYRSMIACGLLGRAGFSNVANVIGGFDAWQQAKLPILSDQTVVA